MQTFRNVRSKRNVSNPKKPVRRPKQQSTDWVPPTKHNRNRELSPKQSVKSKNTENKKPLRQPRQLKNATIEASNKIDPVAAVPKQDKIAGKKLLEQYFAKNNLGEPNFKIAVMGNKGRERFLATITVSGRQYKTYPDSFQTAEQAEEAVSSLAIKTLGTTL